MNKLIPILLIASVLLISGCTQANTPPPVSGEVMKVAYEYWPGMYWVEIADQKGWFEEAGLNVELSFNANENFIASEQALVDGELDVVQFVFFDLMKFRVEGNDLVNIVVNDLSIGGDQIIARGMNSIADIKGKRVGVNQDTFQEFMLAEALKKNGLTISDVVLVQATAEEVGRFVKGDFDVFVTWEPHATKAKKEVESKIIFDSSQIPGLITDGMTFHRSFIEQRPQDVQAYVNVWHKTTKFIKENPDEAFGIIAEIYNVPVEEVAAFAKHDKILDLRDNEVAFTYASGFESLHGTARQINNFMIDKGITNKRLDSIEFIDSRFIRNVE